MFNASAPAANTKPGDGYPLYFDIPTAWGAKRFRMGNRDASPLDQWPDPDVYIHYPDKQLLSFLDVRNTNRTWPGRPDGPLMERVTYAAMELLRRDKVDVAIDMHGAETMFPVTNCIVAPEKSAQIATMASMTVKAMEGFDNHVEPSPGNFRGLSHREIGDYRDTLPFLLEAPIPFLDQPTGPKTVKLMLDGKDPFLLSLSKKKKLFVPYDENGWPMDKRVGQHTLRRPGNPPTVLQENPDRAIRLSGVPRYAEIVKNGVGSIFPRPGQGRSEIRPLPITTLRRKFSMIFKRTSSSPVRVSACAACGGRRRRRSSAWRCSSCPVDRRPGHGLTTPASLPKTAPSSWSAGRPRPTARP